MLEGEITMPEILEAMMLICFGLSWPINLVKNIRARSAKGMSLQFILLIIVGYVAGIASKIISHRINYVLAVYLLNLIVVSINLAVYFYNHHLDRAAQETAGNMEESEMCTVQPHERSHQEQVFMEMNNVSPKGGVVFFGSNHFADLHVGELAQSFNIGEAVCNRSVADISIDTAASMLDVCVLDLKPRKVFVNLGDADLETAGLNIDEFIAKYEWMLYTIHTRTKAEIYVVSLLSSTPEARKINARLKALASENGCDYIDITSALNADRADLRIFGMLKSHMRCHPIDFSEAMSTLSV